MVADASVLLGNRVPLSKGRSRLYNMDKEVSVGIGQRRSKGVFFFALLEFVGTTQFLRMYSVDFDSPVAQSFPHFRTILWIYVLLISVVSPVCGIGLLLLKEWARKLVIIKYSFCLVCVWLFFILLSFFTHYPFVRIIQVFGWALALGTIFMSIPPFFFTRPEVRKQFQLF